MSGHGCWIPSPWIEVTIFLVVRLKIVWLEKGDHHVAVVLLCEEARYWSAEERAGCGKTEFSYVGGGGGISMKDGILLCGGNDKPGVDGILLP